MLVSVTTKGAPAALRVQVWRKLRSMGALYLQPSVCLLPDQPAVRGEVERLLTRAHLEGGSGECLTVALLDATQEASVISRFRAGVDNEYREVLDRIPTLLNELAEERDRGRVTYAEVEESEADLDRFRRWLARIERRDYFGGALRDEARAAVLACERELEAFTAAALAAHTEAADPAGEVGRLTVVRGSRRSSSSTAGPP